MVASHELAGALLFQDNYHHVRADGRVVWCDVCVPEPTPPAAGAESAQRVGQYLIENVLHRRSRWLGFILDVRNGPSVFGPITRQVSVNMFEAAVQARRPLAVLTVPGRLQHSQYCALAAAHGSSFVLVTDSAERARDWMTRVH